MKKFLLLIFIIVCPAMLIFAQENIVEKSIYYGNQVIPKSPDAEKFEIYGKISVNNSKGAPDISIPIYELSVDGVTVPITLNYISSGIRVNEIPTAVGLNWYLNAGGYISRNVNGLADEEDLGWFNVPEEYRPETGWWNQADCDPGQLKLQAIANYQWDAIPDEFSYNFLDQNGSFFFGRDKTCYSGLANELKIEFWDKKTITDKYGNLYIFGGNVESQEINGISIYQEGDLNATEGRNVSATTGWRLTKIITKNGHEIKFTYLTYNYRYNFQSGDNYNWYHYFNDFTQLDDVATTYTRIYTSCNAWASLLTSISIDNIVKVEFNYEDDPSLIIWTKKLASIHIHDTPDQPEVKIYSFLFDKYDDSRLRLTGMQEQNSDGSLIRGKYSFNYNGGFAFFGSKSTDRFGYYNGSSGVTDIPDHIIWPDNQISQTNGYRNRDVNDNWITYGILNEIVYPTGGKTVFHYEPNKVENYYSPGVRIRKIENHDGLGNIYIKQYTYAGLTGFKRQQEYFDKHSLTLPHHYSTTYGDLISFAYRYFLSSGEFHDKPGSNHDYFYTYVSIEDLDAGGNPGIRMDEYYYPYKAGNSIGGFLKTRKYFAEDRLNIVKAEDFSYNFLIKNIVFGYISQDSYYRTLPWYCNGQPMDQSIGVDYYYPNLDTLLFRSTDIKMNAAVVTEVREGNMIVNNSSYEYNEKHQLAKTTNWITGNDDKITTLYKYASDYNTTELDLLKTKNIIGIPLDKRTLNKDNLVTEGSISEPDELGNIIRIYEFESDIPVNNNWSNSSLLSNNFNLRVSYKYDQKGNITEEKSNSITTSLLWGYQLKYPVVIIKGIAYDEIPSAVREAVSHVEYTPDVKSTVQLLKNQLAGLMNDTRYQVTINTYKPLIGISSQTSLNGTTIYYDYDNLGRLKSIIDDDDHILKTFEYHYKQ